MAERPFAVLDGQRDDRTFACPWCGSTFPRRFIASDGVESLEEHWAMSLEEHWAMSLEEHWAMSLECSANRDTNNPTQSKYDAVDPERLVRLVDDEDRDA